MMAASRRDLALIGAIADGLPRTARPYREIGARLGLDEDAVIDGLKSLIDRGVIRRFGVIVRHHTLGYTANAMTVWDVPDDDVGRIARKMAEVPYVTLCYRRPRRLPQWRYNLFCMVHGAARDAVRDQVEHLAVHLGLLETPHEILFSLRQFKQRGAHYLTCERAAE